MNYRFLGKSGLEVSELSFGAWVTFGNQVGDSVAKDCMVAAYDAGVNFFDNAEAYAGGEAERVMGKILSELGWSRDTFVVSSKVFFGEGKSGPNQRGLGRKHIFEACHAALKRLQVEYLDLYFCHRPDLLVPIEETVHAMSELVRQGKVLYWGTSEWSARDIALAHLVARRDGCVPPQMEQPQYNLFCREKVEKDYLPLYSLLGLGTTIWSPLASGLLTGKYNDGIPSDSRLGLSQMKWLKEKVLADDSQSRLDSIKKLGSLADEAGLKLPELALLWCLRNPHVSTVITGASKVEQVRANMASLEKAASVDETFWQKVEAVVQTKPEPDVSLR